MHKLQNFVVEPHYANGLSTPLFLVYVSSLPFYFASFEIAGYTRKKEQWSFLKWNKLHFSTHCSITNTDIGKWNGTCGSMQCVHKVVVVAPSNTARYLTLEKGNKIMELFDSWLRNRMSPLGSWWWLPYQKHQMFQQFNIMYLDESY